MIKFDANKLRIETHELKQCTTALGGSIRVVDEERSTEDNEVYKRIPVPLAVVRQFKNEHKRSKYLKPVVTAVTFYEDRVISLERHPNGCNGQKMERVQNLRGEETYQPWTGRSGTHLSKVAKMVEGETEWFFDGRYIFKMDKATSIEDALEKGKKLTEDGKFRVVNVQAVGLHYIGNERSWKLEEAARTCLAYVSRDQFAISPPIWKSVASVGQAKIARSGFDKGSETTLDWNKVDQVAAVNLGFTMKAAADLSEHFGFEAIEPLNLPDLMVRLNTVNLPKVPKEVKATFDSGMKFTHALAWLLGYARRAETMEAYSTVRGLLKYLTTRGMFFRDSFSAKAIYKDLNKTTVPLRTKVEAIEVAANIDEKTYREIINERSDQRWRERSTASVRRLVDPDEVD